MIVAFVPGFAGSRGRRGAASRCMGNCAMPIVARRRFGWPPQGCDTQPGGVASKAVPASPKPWRRRVATRFAGSATALHTIHTLAMPPRVWQQSRVTTEKPLGFAPALLAALAALLNATSLLAANKPWYNEAQPRFARTD